MSMSQNLPEQPIASGSQPRVILKVPRQPLSSFNVPFLNAFSTTPASAKKMRRIAFKCSLHLRYPSISISDTTSPVPDAVQSIYDDAYLANSSPETLGLVDVAEWKSVFEDYPACEYCASHGLQSTCFLCSNSLSCATCEANYPLSKKFCSFKSMFRLLQLHILAKLPLVVAYRFATSRGNFLIRDEEWAALVAGLRGLSYYQDHPEDLGLAPRIPKVQERVKKPGTCFSYFVSIPILIYG